MDTTTIDRVNEIVFIISIADALLVIYGWISSIFKILEAQKRLIEIKNNKYEMAQIDIHIVSFRKPLLLVGVVFLIISSLYFLLTPDSFYRIASFLMLSIFSGIGLILYFIFSGIKKTYDDLRNFLILADKAYKAAISAQHSAGQASIKAMQAEKIANEAKQGNEFALAQAIWSRLNS